MTIALWIAVVMLVLDTAGVAILLLCRIFGYPTGVSFLDFSPLFVAAGALVALVAFLINLQRARSADTLAAATDLLEKAYQALEAKDGSSRPTCLRIAWLTSARLIATAEALGKQIVEPNHCRIYNEKKEYWRSRFYELIFPSPPSGLPGSFYAEKPEHMLSYTDEDREALSEKSLAYMYRFIQWPKGIQDPIGSVPNFTDEEIDRMQAFGPRELGRLLASVRRLTTKP